MVLMIRSCTCRGGSASSRAVSRNRLAVASCKTCGGKPVVDGKGSLSGSMLSSGGLELTTVFNPDLSWKTVSKGSRSAARRPRKPFVRSVEGSSKLVPGSGKGIDKGDSKRQVDMPVSESEKLGVTILGRHFSNKIEHIPLKKRRFLFRSPSPPPRVPSPHRQDSVRILKGQRAMAIDNSVANELGQVVGANGNISVDIHEDFSGISILAAAACNNSIESCPSDNDEGSAAGKFSVLGGSKGLLKSESRLVAEQSDMDVSENASLAMEETTILCNTPEEVTKKLTMITEDVRDGKNTRSPTVELKDDGTERKLESASRDDRLHWDLNVVMDAWEDPCEDPVMDSQTNSVQGVMIDDCIHSEDVQKVIEDSEKSTHTPEVVETQSAIGSLSSDEVCRIYDHPENSPGKLALEDPFEDSDYGSDVSHDNADPVPVVEKEVQHQTGYDSQYEDGELRESTENNWEEDAGEEVEVEHVDYGSDNREMYGFEAAEEAGVGNGFDGDLFKVKANFKSSIEGFSNSSITETGSSSERTTKAVKQQSRGGYGRTVDIEKYKMDAKVGVSTTASYMGIQENGSCVGGSLVASSRLSAWGKVQESCQSSAVDYRKVEVMGTKDSITGVVGAFAPGVELPNYNEGLTSSETFPRNDRAFIHANRSNFDCSNPRTDMDGSSKSTVRGGSSVHMHGRGRGADTWVDSSRGSWAQNRHHSPSYYGPANFVYPGATNAAAAAAAKVESDGFIVAPDGTIIKAGAVGPSPSGRAQRQPGNSSLQVAHRTITRRVSPGDREAFGIHMGPEPAGEIIPDRSNGLGRSRSGRYGSRVGQTGPRERYILPDDGIDSSMRRRSISPIQRRGIPHLSQPCTRSRSRSRTRSPNAWPSARGRCSRSPPNIRSYTRMDRIRSPHRRPGFGPDHMMEFVPISRRRGSPPHTSRWVEDRRDGMPHVREHGYKQRSSDSGRGSPRRVFRRNHRFDVADSSERFRADEYYDRPMHPGRFPEMVGTGRRPRYDGSDDDKRKHGGRYGIVHRTRRYDTDEPIKRFQYDVEDDFPVRSSRNKDILGGFHSSRGGNIKEDYVHAIDNRLEEAPIGGVRDDKGHLRYGRDGKYDSNSKSFGVGECEDDITPKRRRP